MKNYIVIGLGLALAGAAVAQSPTPQQQFPHERTSTCADMKWHADMLKDHPRVVDACQEVVAAGGTTWARLSAKFVRVNPDGLVAFSIRDSNDRAVEEITIRPVPNQVAYISGVPTQFKDLDSRQSVNLFVPYDRYGFATTVDVPVEQVAPVVRAAPAPAPAAAAPVVVAARAPLPAELPRTASALPWFALGGLVLLFAGLGMTWRRTAL